MNEFSFAEFVCRYLQEGGTHSRSEFHYLEGERVELMTTKQDDYNVKDRGDGCRQESHGKGRGSGLHGCVGCLVAYPNASSIFKRSMCR